MGRRKQLKPTRLADEDSAHASTSSPAPDLPADRSRNGTKKNTDFSISAHLRTEDSKKTEKIQTNGTLEHGHPAEFLSAQRAYQTLMSHLKQQEVWMRSMGYPMSSAAMSPFVGACFPSGDFFAHSPAAGKRSHHKSGPDSAVDLSTKKSRPSSKSKPDETTDESAAKSALARLSSLVTTVGNTPSAIANIMRAHNSAMKNDVAVDPRVFTCLQCFEHFDSIETLVSHMQKTMHYNQKSLNTLTPSKSSSSERLVSTSPTDKTKSSTSTGKSRFSFQCLLCDHSSNSAIDQHMAEKHSFKSPSEWISAVKLIPMQ